MAATMTEGIDMKRDELVRLLLECPENFDVTVSLDDSSASDVVDVQTLDEVGTTIICITGDPSW